ncbi:hypothetical protein C5167_010225 [Papaver somniferum]|uniref:Subtilisin-like protease SBT3.6 n=1 Tax=Papaver somniferum TaxID=3469 RepID=A0A4Y7K3L5_PAPSO|nr:subtilisin-like protease SBT3.6 [Papaver somniferum]RZC66538.1 hypothetical protein C5167_010225 [Papaver somniferum]
MATSLFLLLLLLSLQSLITSASNVHIVYMGEKKQHLEPKLIHESHLNILSTLFSSEEEVKASLLYSYKHGFSGFAAVLTESQAQTIAEFPQVIGVVPNRILSLHTTRSWDFLQLDSVSPGGIMNMGQGGDGAIIGIMDTGIWPESKSFRDHGMGEVPSRWKGVCEEGEEFSVSHCNRKIIGARWYIKGYEAEFGALNTSESVEFMSPRDAVGHGTHTSSIAAGSLVKNASLFGLARGVARGGAPSARLAIYKVCWATGGCSSADLLAAFDDAIYDGVDVLSVSLGSPPPLASYVEDILSIGSFHAVAKGINVVCSGGNSGPYAQTVINTAPWVITVAASTIDRAFPTSITFGNNQTIVGQAFYIGKHVHKLYPIVFGQDIASSDSDEDKAKSCDVSSLNATLAKGKVVLCFQSRQQTSGALATRTVTRAGGVGVIFAQFPTKTIGLSLDFPSIQLDYEMATLLLTYMGTTREPVVRFSRTKTVLGRVTSPEVAFFSSRGPSSLSPAVLKPDIAAPGVNILASWPSLSPPSSSMDHNQLPVEFNIESGTSMSCPHISGVVALLKTVHPNWSPAAIKSALITTASIKDEYGLNIVAEGAPHKQADPFDYGGGHVNPNKALDPGLVYDMGILDHVHFLCSMGYNNSIISLMTKHPVMCSKASKLQTNLNLPSIFIPELRKSSVVWRTVTNVGPVNSVYTASVKAPPGVKLQVTPSVLSFNSTTTKLKFKVCFQSKLTIQGRYAFGSLSWKNALHVVRIPLIVRTVINDFYADT